MIGFDALHVDLAVVLGKTRLPLNQLLRITRGATIPLEEAAEDDTVDILANGLPVARGQVSIRGSAIMVEVTEILRKPEISRVPGTTIDGRVKDRPAPAEAA
ncbi:MAG: FliM/FliN family flagellar motor switch protein [Methylobacteriaceae bacterium]|nr:FliM/FliN family flagellar motor switch protein [Methylobacteriaceae bacterium]